MPKQKKEKNIADDWSLVYKNYKPAKEGLRESLCTLANGYMGTRGAATEMNASRINYPATYIAGVYNRLATKIAGRKIWNEDMVNCPNWLCLVFRYDDNVWISPVDCKILSYDQTLDMQRGILSRSMRLKDKKGRIVRIKEQRFVSMAQAHRAAIQYNIVFENYEGPVVVRSALNGEIKNSGVERYSQLKNIHLEPVSLGTRDRNVIFLGVKTNQSQVVIGQAARTRFFTGAREFKPRNKKLVRQKKYIAQDFFFKVKRAEVYTVEKMTSVYTSRDQGCSNPVTYALVDMGESLRFHKLLYSHVLKMKRLWEMFDIQIDGDGFSQKILRLHLFHLIQTASENNEKLNIDAGLAARGLHGEAYRGHIFWDDLFVMHLYDFRSPGISKALLMYRYRRLDKARALAKAEGYRGAMFPWQSGSSGDEETQTLHLNPMSGKWGPDHSHSQRHVSFAVAYNFWKYWERTQDKEFLESYGAEVIVSIAQLGASLSKYHHHTGRYHTEGLMGPDEFHEKMPGSKKTGFKDNAYTNILIVWTLLRGLEVLGMISEEKREALMKKLGITREDIAHWDDITTKMNVIFNDQGIIAQFDGYFSLKEINLKSYQAKYDNIQRMDRILKAEGKSPNDYKVAKQADVLMLFYLFEFSQIKSIVNHLGYKFDRSMLKNNYDYYVQRTSHGSTLSKVVHCYISHILGRKKEAWQWFGSVLESDINDTQGGTTPEGIHAGVMGGSIYIAVKGFAGVHFVRDRIMIDPKLAKRWSCVRLNLLYRGNRISLSIKSHEVTIAIIGGQEKQVPVFLNDQRYLIKKNTTHRIKI